jgi:hypothetical protein
MEAFKMALLWAPPYSLRSEDTFAFMFYLFFGFYSNGVQDGGELLDIIVKGEKPGKEKQYRLPPFGLIPLEG